MREIIFRGKRVDNGEWVEGGSLLQFLMIGGCKKMSIAPRETKPHIKKDGQVIQAEEIFPETVGQYTGLTDKNGTRIYEGDIIKSKQDGMIGVIRFGEYQTTNSENGECHLGFSIEWYGKYSDLLRKDLGWWINLKIIGNIYDNPELLKGE